MDFYCCPAIWRAARQIVRAAALIVCLCVSVYSTEINAQSPAPHPEAHDSAIQTITAADITSAINLDGPWRFHAGDDPRFADPSFDDSAWPTVRPNQDFKSAGISVITGKYLWARIHLRVPTDVGRLALAVYPLNTVYEVFANGSSIAFSPGMAERTARFSLPFSVALPPSQDVVLAIRFYFYCDCGFNERHVLPFIRVSLGSLAAIQTVTELERLRDLIDWSVADYLSLGIILLLAVTAMLLYRAQRNHDEYLWLGISSLFLSLFIILNRGMYAGWLPVNLGLILSYDYAGWLFNAASIEFFVRFTRVGRRWPIRIAQGAMLIPPLFLVLSKQDIYGFSVDIASIYGFAIDIGLFLYAAVVAVCLISACRRGMAESGLLLIPAVAGASLDFAWVAAGTFPTIVPWGPAVHFGAIGISLNYLGEILSCLGVAAVILYRFVRVTRDEERAAAELEAARTVQQILVPEEVPSIPGFSIQAVYQPAGEVGGDFYQVLPTANGDLLAVIGDVSGKGMPAAMTVSLLVGTVRTLAHYTHDPAEILTAMNQRMIGRGHGGFTTALVLRLDSDGTLTAANAGHIAPYANGKELTIDNGLPLGITAAAAYCNSTLHLEADTTLTLLTDGVVEAQNDQGELFGFDRSRELSSSPAATIVEAARAFGQEDDITVLTLGFAPAEVSRA